MRNVEDVSWRKASSLDACSLLRSVCKRTELQCRRGGERFHSESERLSVSRPLSQSDSSGELESGGGERAVRAGGTGTHRPGDKDQSEECEECEECVHRGFLTFTHHPASLARPHTSLYFSHF